jgi:RHS repeat-associated protein
MMKTYTYDAPSSRVLLGTRCRAANSTGKERDSESGLDNFGARYDSSSLGRFMRPDPQNAGASPEEPQSWNAYAYAGNNPLNNTDPDGLNYLVCDNGGKNCADLSDKQYDQFRFHKDAL